LGTIAFSRDHDRHARPAHGAHRDVGAVRWIDALAQGLCQGMRLITVRERFLGIDFINQHGSGRRRRIGPRPLCAGVEPSGAKEAADEAARAQ
jgi:hypothetical protein